MKSEMGTISSEGTAGALVGSMQAVKQALMQQNGVSDEQMLDRLEEWQALVKQLAGGAR